MKTRIYIIGLAITLLMSCSKFLDEKPNVKLLVPVKINDLQGLLDDLEVLNQQEPAPTEVAADDYRLSEANWKTLDEFNRNLYVWAPAQNFVTGAGSAWTLYYTQIYKANVVLNDIDNMHDTQSNPIEAANVAGQALFTRSRSFFNALQVWALNYNEVTAATDLGVPLRLNVDFDEPTKRATVAESYSQVVNDLTKAVHLLPVTPLHVIRPSKPAACGLLARVFLSMNKVDSCLKYTQLALSLKNELMDYNGDVGINATANFPFLRFNKEVVFDSYMPHPAAVSKGEIAPELYEMYETNDLRRNLYHRSASTIGYFKGTYAGSNPMFNGIATNELYLMKAECLIRSGEVQQGLNTLNDLLRKRYKNDGSFAPKATTNPETALTIVLSERRKELVFRGLRWMDIKRLNAIGRNIYLKRTLGTSQYTLNANDLRFALAIPEDIIVNTNIPQNRR